MDFLKCKIFLSGKNIIWVAYEKNNLLLCMEVIVKIKPKPGDFIILIIIIFLALSSMAVFTQKSSDVIRAVISKNGEILYNISLNEVKKRIEIRSEDIYNQLIIVENGRIRFEESDCPDKVCVRTGWIFKPGQSAVCLPSGTIIKIVGEDNDDIDIILK